MLSIRLASGMNVDIDHAAWPEIGRAEWTDSRNGGVVVVHVVVRRHANGRTVMYIDSNPGEGPFVHGDLLPRATNEIEDAVSRFGELHEIPNRVIARCVESIRR